MTTYRVSPAEYVWLTSEDAPSEDTSPDYHPRALEYIARLEDIIAASEVPHPAAELFAMSLNDYRDVHEAAEANAARARR